MNECRMNNWLGWGCLVGGGDRKLELFGYGRDYGERKNPWLW